MAYVFVEGESCFKFLDVGAILAHLTLVHRRGSMRWQYLTDIELISGGSKHKLRPRQIRIHRSQAEW